MRKLPEVELQAAHRHSIRHRNEILDSDTCGCFYCKQTFTSSDITDWTDEDARGVGETALCPRCGIDAVIGDASGYRPTPEFLQRMHTAWFGV